MALTVTKQTTQIISCDSITGWTSETISSPGADADFKIEGVASISSDVDVETGYLVYTWATNQNFSTLNVWWYFLGLLGGFLDTWVNGGLRIKFEDSSANTSEWYVGGKDTYSGGWKRFVVYTGSTPDYVSGTVVWTAIRKVKFGFKALTKSKLADNVFIDDVRTGSVTQGIKVTGGSLGSEGDFDEVVSGDETAIAGVIRKAGSYFINGAVQFGDTATNSIFFADNSQVIYTEDTYRTYTTGNRGSVESLVSASHYKVTIINYATGTCNFELGTKSGSRGVQGCTFISQDAGSGIDFIATDGDIDVLKLYGCKFQGADSIALPSTTANREVIDFVAESCGEILADTCKLQYFTIITPKTKGVRMSGTTHNISDGTIIDPPNGVNIPNTGTYTFDNLVFSGTNGTTKYDVENSSSGLVTINATNGSNPSYVNNSGGGATTTINNAVNLKVTVKDSSGTGITGVRVLMEADSGGSAPHEVTVTITRVTTTATVSHTAHGLATGQYVIIRKADQQEYNGVFTITKIDANSYSFTVSGTPVTPATGTIKATQAFMSELSVAGGVAEESFNFGAAQPYTGVARKSSGTPFYRDSSFSGTIGSGGLDIPVQLELDE